MKFIDVKRDDHDTLSFIKPLYETSFPKTERRDWSKLVKMLDNGQMQMDVIKDEEVYVGFIVWWRIGEWHYLEHFAVNPILRGQQYGRRIMEMFLNKYGGRLVLEVEYANDVDSQRRIEFYKRLGLEIIGLEYYQPPYTKNGKPIAMHLMTGEKETDLFNFKEVVDLIRRKVYEQFY